MQAHDLHKEKMQLFYKRIQASKKNTKYFILDLHSFIHEICNGKTFSSIIQSIQSEQTRDFLILTNLELQALKEMSLFFIKVQKYIKIKNISHAALNIAIKEYKKFDKLQTHHEQTSILTRFEMLNTILALLMCCEAPSTKQFVEHNAIIDLDLNYLKLHENSSQHRSYMHTLISEFMKQNKMIEPQITQLLNQFNLVANDSEQKVSAYQYKILIDILVTLSQKNNNTYHHIEFVQKHAELNEMGNLTQSTFAPSIYVYQKEIERVKMLQESRVWYNWHSLLKFFLVYEDKEAFINQEKTQHNFVYALALKKEYEKFINDCHATNTDLKIDFQLYKRNTFVLWTFIKPFINEARNINHLLNKTQIEQCQGALHANDLEGFINNFKSMVASIPYQIRPKDESAFHIILHLITGGSSEESTNNGRIDLVYSTATHIYIFELKFKKNVKHAIDQIYQNRYFEKFLNSDKSIVLIGLSINAKGLISHQVEPLNLKYYLGRNLI